MDHKTTRCRFWCTDRCPGPFCPGDTCLGVYGSAPFVRTDVRVGISPDDISRTRGGFLQLIRFGETCPGKEFIVVFHNAGLGKASPKS